MAARRRKSGSWALIVAVTMGTFLLGACAGPRSVVEVRHFKDRVADGHTDDLKPLIKALGSTNEAVRGAAVRALGELGEVAEPALRKTVEEDSARSGPALLALGYGGNPESLSFIERYRAHPTLGPQAAEAARSIERQLFQKVSRGDLDAMDAYLEAFPDSPRASQVRSRREAFLAQQAFTEAKSRPDPESLESFLARFGSSEYAPEARVLLARRLLEDGRRRLEAKDYVPARAQLARVAGFDRRQEPTAKRLIARAYLMEGRDKLEAGDREGAIDAFERAATHPEFKIEAEKLLGSLLIEQAHEAEKKGDIGRAIEMADRAAALDPTRGKEALALKRRMTQDLEKGLESDDAQTRKRSIRGLLSLRKGGIHPLEVYIGKNFADKNYARVEEFVGLLAEFTNTDEPDPTATRLAEMLATYVRTALRTSTREVRALFASSDFIRGWRAGLDPLDPREYPLVYKVEEICVRHLGLSRIGVGVQSLLGKDVLDLGGTHLLSDDELDARLAAGSIGQDPADPLLVRVQLAAKYSQAMGEFSRLVVPRRDQFMVYAVGLTVPPLTPLDWIQVAAGFNTHKERLAVGARPRAASLKGGLHGGRVTLVRLDYNMRSLTVQVYDPIVERLGGGDPSARDEAVVRTLTILFNSARMAFGIYPGIDRYTVILGHGLPTAAGKPPEHFEPEVRLMIDQKRFRSLDWKRLREMNGVYDASMVRLTDIRWFRWKN